MGERQRGVGPPMQLLGATSENRTQLMGNPCESGRRKTARQVLQASQVA